MGTGIDLAAIEKAFVEAAIDPERWNDAMEVATKATGSFGAVLFDTHGRLHGFPQSESMRPASESYVRDGWIDRDIRYELAPIIARRGIATDLDLLTPERIRQHAYYQEFLAPFRLRWFAGVKVASGDSLWCLSLQRSISQGPFPREQLLALTGLSHRLGAASAISRMLGFGRIDTALEVFETSGTPAIVFDLRGDVLRLNGSAERLLCAELSIIGRRIASIDRRATAAFERALKQVIIDSPRAAASAPVALPRFGRRPLLAYVLGLKSVAYNPLAPGQAVAVFIDPEAEKQPGFAALQTCFSLTQAEALLAQKLGTGRSLEQAAFERKISYETARNQLKAVFAKTNTHKQTELVSLLTNLCAESPAKRFLTAPFERPE